MDNRSISSISKISSGSSSYTTFQKKNPLEKVFSKKNIAQAAMPPFLRTKKTEHRKESLVTDRRASPDERTPSPLNRYSDSFSNIESQRSRRLNSSGPKLDFSPDLIEELEEFVQNIRIQKNKDKDIIKINNFCITTNDFLSLIDPLPLTRKIIDACLTVFKKQNHELLMKDKGTKVAICSTGFAWKIFNKCDFKDLHAPSYLLKYAVILFPIFVGHWTLLEVNIQDLSVHYYDLLNTKIYLESILISCYQFLEQEFHYHKGDDNDLNQIKTLKYENVKIECEFDKSDSGLYILLLAKKSCVPPLYFDDDLTRADVKSLKEEIARTLLDNCEKLIDYRNSIT